MPTRPSTSFFFRLPTDVQILVIQSWTSLDQRELLLTLSALDKATCNKSLRPSLLLLTSDPCLHKPFEGEITTLFNYKPSNINWLHSRQVTSPVYSHGKSVPAGVVLPQITELCITLFAYAGDAPVGYSSILQACPNLTSLTTTDEKKSFWTSLIAVHPAKLTRLVCDGPLGDDSIEGVKQCLSTLSNLLELRINSVRDHLIVDAILTVLAESCHRLEKLGIGVAHLSLFPRIADVFRSCSIQDIKMTLYAVFAAGQLDAGIASVLDHHQPLHKLKLTVCQGTTDGRQVFPCFLITLENYPWLEAVSFCFENICHWDRVSAEMTFAEQTSTTVATVGPRLFAACPVVSKLNLVNCGKSITERLEEHCHSGIVELLIGHSCFMMLSRPFPHVQILKIQPKYSTFTDETLQLVARLFKQLRVLVLQNNLYPKFAFTDVGMEALFTGCSHLKELIMEVDAPLVTSKTLDALLASGLRLEKFAHKSVGFKQADIDRYRAAAKKLMMFPVAAFSSIKM